MVKRDQYFLIFAILIFFGSCAGPRRFGSIQIEVRQPASFTFPSEIKTVTLINRDSFVSDSILAINYLRENWIKADTSLNARLTNVFVSSLAKNVKNESLFDTVSLVNGESARSIYSKDQLQMNDIFRKAPFNLYVLIDSLYLNEVRDDYSPNLFRHKVCLNWSLVYRTGDSLVLVHQKDSVEYFDFLVTYYKNTYILPYGRLYGSCKDIGALVATRLVPHWSTVQRVYFRSNNQDMKTAGQFLLQNDFTQSAEIWNKKAQSKNADLAAKATYNMALACEMDGKFSIAIEWLNKYLADTISGNKKYIRSFKQYRELLEQRLKDKQLIDLQLQKS